MFGMYAGSIQHNQTCVMVNMSTDPVTIMARPRAELLVWYKNNRCATTLRQTTDRKSTRRQKLTDKKIFTDTTTERQRQVADTTTHRQKPIICFFTSQLRLH